MLRNNYTVVKLYEVFNFHVRLNVEKSIKFIHEHLELRDNRLYGEWKGYSVVGSSGPDCVTSHQ